MVERYHPEPIPGTLQLVEILFGMMLGATVAAFAGRGVAGAQRMGGRALQMLRGARERALERMETSAVLSVELKPDPAVLPPK